MEFCFTLAVMMLNVLFLFQQLQDTAASLTAERKKVSRSRMILACTMSCIFVSLHIVMVGCFSTKFTAWKESP